jgi:hypothetical protein
MTSHTAKRESATSSVWRATMSSQFNIYEAASRVAMRERVLAALCAVAATVALLMPAIVNGYPFVFADTGTYLHSAMRLYVPYDRPVFYSIFAVLLHWHLTPWPIVIAQSALIVILIRLVAKAVFNIASPWVTPIATIALVIGSSLPWFSGQIVPDIFTSVLMLALLLITFGWGRMTLVERWFALCLVPVCVAVHNANLFVPLSVLPAIGILRLVGWRPGPQAAHRTFWVASGVVLALAALVSSNYAARGKLVLSAASSTFLFAKMLEDGPAMAVLEHDCPATYPLLCSQLPFLQAHKAAGVEPTLADFFLWDGPLDRLGWWKPVEPEASQVVKKVFAQFGRQEVLISLGNGARQFWHFKTGDGLDSDPGIAATDAIRDLFGESSLATYQASLQGKGELRLSSLNVIHLVTLAVSSGILAWAAIASFWADRKALHIAAFILAMLAGHAMAMGAFTPLHDRYQSRVVWLIPMFASLTLCQLAFKLTPSTARSRIVRIQGQL